MFADSERIEAAALIDAMLEEARGALSAAEKGFEYWQKEYDKAHVRYESAKGIVMLLEGMREDLDEVEKFRGAYNRHSL